MKIRAKLWVESDGKLVLSDYRAQLLRLIDETGSLAGAAAAMDLSYRRAWGKVREMEMNLGADLLERRIGGPGGGGSRLTPEARSLVERYEQFRTSAEQELATKFSRSFEGAEQ